MDKVWIVSPQEFKKNQNAYLDKIDEGAEVLIERENERSYRVVPVQEFVDVPEEYIQESNEDLENAISLEEMLEYLKEGIHEMFKDKREQG
ncbi:MAG: type II toxin-antitoxin system Phd/YefM family antitoxin [Mediterranea sp.]|jgi:PHD/YefM family antitoxin component YafN of YafNO toxin-antitoxin module|nr:type II toxin-antitoxin system Phd/YefM family antitoxin [Mediterranea sp.]